ncbi:MAG: xanthan lyase, partial [Pedosphaera sp.]|nr:xanthan lyase [Pedosphaera sp.]
MKALFFLSLFLLACSLQSAEIITADVCIYGGTAGGVAAAVETARLGKTAVIAEFGSHLGGMSSGGLSQTDIGNKAAIGGIAREFYRRMGKHYGKEEQWSFEPSVAEDIFFTFVN